MKNTQDKDTQRLASWQVDPVADPQFRARVWQALESKRDASLRLYFRQHALVCSLSLCFALVAGVWVGQTQASQRAARDRETLASAYLASIDARYQVATHSD